MNSDINKDKEKKKKRKEKKFHGKKGEITSKVQGDQKKGSILSKLDTLDEIVKKESRIVEETLRSGLLKSEQAEKEEIVEREELTLIEIKKEINNLQIIKNKYHAEGIYEKAIKTSKKIIVLAFSNNLKSVVNAENKFLDIIRKKVILEHEKLDIHKEDESMETLEVELCGQDFINEGVGLELNETEIQERSQIEEEKRNLKIAKQEFEQEKLQFEEKEEKLKQERIRFEEEKEAFKWEKLMFEEVKKHEKERINNLKEIKK